MIKTSPGSLRSPYRRIIFSLSICDTLQSFALISGPFLTPKSEQHPWSVGNVRTCDFNASALVSGMIGVPCYTLTLCVYYLCKVKYSMTDGQFIDRFERRIHIAVAFLVICGCVGGIITKSFNPVPSGSVCGFSGLPVQCRHSPQLAAECDRGQRSGIFIVLFVLAIPTVLFSSIIMSVAMLCMHAFRRASIFRANLGVLSEDTLQISSGRGVRSDDGNSLSTTGARLARLYEKEATIQAILYSSAFFGVYFLSYFIAITNSRILKRDINMAPDFRTIVAIFFPLGGLFNILIYSRPVSLSLIHFCS